MAKIISVDQAVDLIRDGMTVGVSGFGAFSSPDSILEAIGQRYRERRTPKDLTIVSGVAPGDFQEDGCGMSKIAYDGLVKTMIASHLRMSPPMGRAVSENRVAAFSLPLGVYGQLLSAIGGGRPGVVTHVGLNTYADPTQEGCCINPKAKAQGRTFVERVRLDGRDYLFYRAFPIDACLLHASYGDELGNISVQEEPIRGELVELAAAVHNRGGVVIVEVNDIVKAGTLDPRHILIHRSYVDYLVKAQGGSNVALGHHPELTGQLRVPTQDRIRAIPLSAKKVIARRAALELRPQMLVNLGIGIPASVANIANEEGIHDQLTLSLETGVYGGVPLDGPLFGSSMNPESLSRSADMFVAYDGGGLDLTVLGAAEVDSSGNVNVSRFAGRCVGPGGFVDISQNTPKVCFAFSFTSGQQRLAVEGGRLVIQQDGSGIKFKGRADQITFSAQYARQTGQQVLFITERAVFALQDQGLALVEIAPGVDLERDILAKMEFQPAISPALRPMVPRLFRPQPPGLAAAFQSG